MTAAAPATELGAANRDHVHSRVAQQRVGVRVPVVGDDHARLQRDDVVAVVPLLALRLPGIAAGLDDAQRLQAEGAPDDVEEMTGILADLDAALAVRTRAIAADLIGDVAEGGTRDRGRRT